MGLSTAFTELVGCELPIQLAPMGGGIGSAELAAAVSDAGGMGAIAVGGLPAEAVEMSVDRVRALTSGPLAVNFLMPFLDHEAVEAALHGATVVDFYHGEPDADLVRLVHDGGVLAGWMVCSVDDADAAAAAGCDLLVVRGVEGGGRMYGRESLWPLLVEIVERVDVPVLASGGIGDGRGVAAALVAGAGGVRMGTRFLAAAESGVQPVYRQAVIAATGADSVLTEDFSVGWPDECTTARVLRSSVDAAASFDGDVVGAVAFGADTMPIERFSPMPPGAAATGSVEAMAMYAGESVRFVHGVEPAADIVRGIADTAEALLR